MKPENVDTFSQILKLYVSIEPREDRSSLLRVLAELDEQRQLGAPIAHVIPVTKGRPLAPPAVEGEDLTFKQAAKEIGITEQSLYVQLRRGKIKAKRNATGSLVVTRDYVEQYKQKRADREAGKRADA